MKEFKPLMKINSETFLSAITKKLLTICDDVVIVAGHNSSAINFEISNSGLLSKCRVIVNENYQNGMFSSLQRGLEEINSNWVIYHFVDQPSLPEEFYKAFSEEISNNYDWIQPVNKGRKGHPIIFDRKVCEMILSKNSKSTLRDISHDSSVVKHFWNCDTDLIFQDIDTIEDFIKISE